MEPESDYDADEFLSYLHYKSIVIVAQTKKYQEELNLSLFKRKNLKLQMFYLNWHTCKDSNCYTQI